MQTTDKVRAELYVSVVMLRPLTPGAEVWMRRNLGAERWQWMGGALACDNRYVADIVDAMQAAGIEILPGA